MPELIERYCVFFGATRCETASNSELLTMAAIGLALVVFALWAVSRLVPNLTG